MAFRKQYTNLHTHSIGSMLDGQGKPSAYFERAAQLGMEGLAVTDHGNLHTMLEWYDAGIDAGVKPILGMEAYQARKTRHDRDEEERAGPARHEWDQRGPYHLTILAKNHQGYKNLIRLSSFSYLEGVYVKPRIDYELLSKYSDGLIILSGCLNGEVLQALRREDYDYARHAASTMRDIVGRENYFLEIMDHGIDIQRNLIPDLIKLSKDLDIPLVPTGDCHYVHAHDADTHDVMLCLQTKSTVHTEGRFKFAGPEFYLKSYDEMVEIFEPEWLENSMNICDMVDLKLDFGEFYFPNFNDVPENLTTDEHLESLVWTGAKEKYGELTDEVVDRINYELGVVKRMGFQEYFLVVEDIINWGKSQGIRFGPGRGCLTGDAGIVLSNGMVKPLEDVNIGDECINKFGQPGKVVRKFEYPCDEELVKLHSYYGDFNGVTLTKDHKVLVEKSRRPKGYENWSESTKCSHKSWEDPTGELEWVEASQIGVGDWVFQPIPSVPIADIAYIDLGEVCDGKRSIADENTVSEYYVNIGRVEFLFNTNRFIDADEDFFRVLGWYAGNGWLNSHKPNTFGLCFNSTHTAKINACVSYFQSKNIPITVRESKSSLLTQIDIRSGAWTSLIRSLFGQAKSKDKAVPDIVMSGADKSIAGFLRGYAETDGHEAKNKFKFTSASRVLMDQVRFLLLRLGIPSSLVVDDRVDERKEFSGRGVAYSVVCPLDSRFASRNTKKAYVWRRVEGGILTKVRSVSSSRSEKVYDIEMEGEHSYQTSSFVVHNSATGSILSYCLSITDLDPLQFGLLFERFLVEGRKSMPDIDIDIDDRYRDKVIDYVRDKYGDSHVAHIATMGTIKAKSALRDAARALGYEYSVGDTLSKMIPPAKLGVEKTIDESLAMNSEMAKAYELDPDSKKVIDVAKGLEGVYRQTGIHAAGVVISRDPVYEHAPVMKRTDPNSPIVTQWTMDDVERVGLLKIDFLGLRNLSVIDICIDSINKRKDLHVNVSSKDLDDPLVYENLRKGFSVGTFQIESAGMRSMMLGVQPESIEDIMALLSLYRPGPMGSGMDKMYIDRKHGRQKLDYMHPSLKPVLGDSYGIMLYQEDVLNVCRTLAGFDAGEADDLRKVIGKKKMEEVHKYRKKFVEGCVKTSNISSQLADEIYSKIEFFAGYGFNRAHAASYAVISYQTALLKYHYPEEYMAALLTSVGNKKEKLAVYLNECRMMNIKVLPPSFLESDHNFTVKDDQEILFGLSAIDGIGQATIDSILEERGKLEANNIYAFYRAVDNALLNKATLSHLSKSGALDALVPDDKFVELRQEDRADLLELERKELGLYVTDHPLLDVWPFLEDKITNDIASLEVVESGQMVVLGGIINTVTKRITKRGQLMYIISLGDLTGDIEIVVFPREATKITEGTFQENSVAIIEGQLVRDGVGEHADYRIFFKSIESLDVSLLRGTAPIRLKVDRPLTSSEIEKLNGIIESKAGDSLVFLEVTTGNQVTTFRFNKRTKPEQQAILEQILALGSVEI